MKKIIFCCTLPLLIAGCTNAEQDEKIQSFWKAQLGQLMPQPPMPPVQLIPAQPEESVPPVEQPVPDEPQQPVLEAQATVRKQPLKQAKQTSTSYQFMEITMEDDSSKTIKTNRKVSSKDRVLIQRALENARLANQKTLRDIGQIFGPETQAKAFGVVSRSEHVLQSMASESESAKKYMDTQAKVLRQQEQALNKIMQGSARNLRAVRG